MAVDLPFTGYLDDRAALVHALHAYSARPVVCAHSSTGMLISDPAVGSVAHLVYIAAFMPEEGEDPMGLSRSAPATELEMECAEDGTCRIRPEVARRAFYPDLDPTTADAAIERLRPMNVGSLLSPPATSPLWRSVPSTYVVCAHDRAFHPDLQRRLAARATYAVELQSGHAPFISHPDAVADILAEVALPG